MDTDHTTGVGQIAITGRYDSRKDSFGVDANYALDGSNTVYSTYSVTDEKVLALGLESGFTAFGRRNTIDLVYHPPRDNAGLKVSVRQGKTKVSGIFSFDNIQANNIKDTTARYELDAKLNGMESLKMSFDGKSRAAKIKLSRKLDSRNRFEAEYSYATPDSKFVSLSYKHFYSKNNTFVLSTNYGSRRYKIEWDCKTDNGPWNVSTSFPFGARQVFFCLFEYQIWHCSVRVLSVPIADSLSCVCSRQSVLLWLQPPHWRLAY